MSLPAAVDLSGLVLGHSLVEAEEIALTGGGSLAGRAQRLRWTAAADGGGGGDKKGGDRWTITLGPMEIKTYRLQLAPHQ